MTAGLPGAGIGGLFYLLGAIVLPARNGWRWMTGRRNGLRGREVAFQLILALGILAGIWATGWLLGVVLGPGIVPQTGSGVSAGVGSAANVVRWAAFLAGFLTLGLVLGTVQVARAVVTRPRRSQPERAIEA